MFYKVGDQIRGPFSADELRQKAATGEILPDTPVANRVDGHWIRAEQVQGLYRQADSPSAVTASIAGEKPASRVSASDSTITSRMTMAHMSALVSGAALALLISVLPTAAIVAAIVAIVLGHSGLKSDARKWAMFGLTFGWLTIALVVLCVVFVFLEGNRRQRNGVPNPSDQIVDLERIAAELQGVNGRGQPPRLESQYSTRGHPKARGLAVTIRYPAGWQRAEGERPHIVQKFSEPGASGLATRVASILVDELPELAQFSEDEVYAELCAMPDVTEELREMFPPSAHVVSVRVTKYDGVPGLLCEYVTQSERAGIQVEMRSICHRVLHRGKFISLDCTVVGPAGSPEIRSLFEESRALFTQMGISIVVEDKWLEGG